MSFGGNGWYIGDRKGCSGDGFHDVSVRNEDVDGRIFGADGLTEQCRFVGVVKMRSCSGI